jgi:putative ABC transport system substrate-binding protein
MATAGDPVRLGVVPSFARPGGNVTGVTLYGTELNAKRIELFREAIPGIKQIAFLANAKNLYGQFLWEEAEPAARARTRFVAGAGNGRPSCDIRPNGAYASECSYRPFGRIVQ